MSRYPTTQQPSTRSRLGPLRWTVPSATTRGITYEVTADPVDGRLICNCPAATFRPAAACKHAQQVAAGGWGKPRVRLCPAPAGRLPVDDLYS
jgi:hypothetical protein